MHQRILHFRNILQTPHSRSMIGIYSVHYAVWCAEDIIGWSCHIHTHRLTVVLSSVSFPLSVLRFTHLTVHDIGAIREHALRRVSPVPFWCWWLKGSVVAIHAHSQYLHFAKSLAIFLISDFGVHFHITLWIMGASPNKSRGFWWISWHVKSRCINFSVEVKNFVTLKKNSTN